MPLRFSLHRVWSKAKKSLSFVLFLRKGDGIAIFRTPEKSELFVTTVVYQVFFPIELLTYFLTAVTPPPLAHTLLCINYNHGTQYIHRCTVYIYLYLYKQQQPSGTVSKNRIHTYTHTFTYWHNTGGEHRDGYAVQRAAWIRSTLRWQNYGYAV